MKLIFIFAMLIIHTVSSKAHTNAPKTSEFLPNGMSYKPLVVGANFIYMETEIWKDVVNYEGRYQVSNFGNIKSLPIKTKNGNGWYIKKGNTLKQHIQFGYSGICLRGKNMEKKRFQVHRLIAIAFIPNPENKKCVNHKNSIRHDNRLENLEWATHSENNLHAFKYGFQKPNFSMKGKFGYKHHNSKPMVQLSLDGVFVKEYSCARDITDQNGYCGDFIARVCKRNSLYAKGFIWKYKKDYEKASA